MKHELPRTSHDTGAKTYPGLRKCCLTATLLVVIGLYSLLVLRFDSLVSDWRFVGSSHEDKSIAANNVLIPLHPKEHINRPTQTFSTVWNITKGWRRPDGVLKQVYLINDQFPGPTIEARSGDEVHITVHNSLEDDDDGVSIHWHGLRIENLMDGVSGVTQCPIQSGNQFLYKLKIPQDQAGTFWYHSHSSVQRADGLYGAFVIHDPVSEEAVDLDYSEDHVLSVGDWHHRSASDVLAYYDDWKTYKIEPVGDSMLLNGRGRFDCNMAVPARPLDCQESPVPIFELSAQKSRLRIINTGTLLGFNVSVEGISMRVIQVDGGNNLASTKQTASIGVLYPGERIDVILERPNEGHGTLTVSFDETMMQFPNLALEPEQQFPIVTSAKVGLREADVLEDHPAAATEQLDLAGLRGVQHQVPAEVDRTILLYTNIAYLSRFENRPRGRINHTIWEMPAKGDSPLLALDEMEWPKDPSPFMVNVERGQSVDLVINNLDDKPHNFHLHGHDFSVLQMHQASRVGSYEAYNPFESDPAPGGPLNYVDPVKKDTVVVPSMGYVVLRFQAEMLGLWMLHCHILWHESVGMAMAFRVFGSSNPNEMNAMKTAARESCR